MRRQWRRDSVAERRPGIERRAPLSVLEDGFG